MPERLNAPCVGLAGCLLNHRAYMNHLKERPDDSPFFGTADRLWLGSQRVHHTTLLQAPKV